MIHTTLLSHHTHTCVDVLKAKEEEKEKKMFTREQECVVLCTCVDLRNRENVCLCMDSIVWGWMVTSECI